MQIRPGASQARRDTSPTRWFTASFASTSVRAMNWKQYAPALEHGDNFFQTGPRGLRMQATPAAELGHMERTKPAHFAGQRQDQAVP
jgi:hypothetical protein